VRRGLAEDELGCRSAAPPARVGTCTAITAQPEILWGVLGERVVKNHDAPIDIDAQQPTTPAARLRAPDAPTSLRHSQDAR
jgi:hypothetical protein